ncbi:hypothetical protein PHYPSEUDO_011485, partial [Phytophthora pseudosyringae]
MVLTAAADSVVGTATPRSGGVGPTERLPSVSAMVQQVASNVLTVPPLQLRSVTDADFGLVPDLLAAAGCLSPVLTPAPSAPSSRAFGDLTLFELTSFLPEGGAE